MTIFTACIWTVNIGGYETHVVAQKDTPLDVIVGMAREYFASDAWSGNMSAGQLRSIKLGRNVVCSREIFDVAEWAGRE